MGKSSGGSGGGTSTQTVQQNADPWTGQQPYLRNVFQQARSRYNQGGPQPFQNPSYVPFAPQTEAALGLQQERAMQGSPVMNQARGLMHDTLGGDFLTPDSNPYLSQYFNQGAEQIVPQVDAAFGMSGRTGSGAHANAFGNAMANLATGIYGPAYESERGRQMQSMLFAPQVAAADYQDIGALADVGRQVEAKAGEQLGDRMRRYDAQQWRPEQALDRYAQRVAGTSFGQSGSSTSTSQQPSYSNPLGSAIGGGLAGVGLGGAFTPGGLSSLGLAGAAPWALGGAALGGLLGLF